MNKLLAGALLASALVPAAAQAQDWNHGRDRDHREWRDDRRGNYGHDEWRGWRDRHPDYYRRGTWRAPFAYRAFGVGAVVPRAYWGSQYYVNDWERYRLPRPGYGYYRYVRHYDDVLLIDVRNGRVVRSYRSFYR